MIHIVSLSSLPELTPLSNAVNCTGEAYEEIAKIVDAQPKHDWEPFGDVMHDYRGMLAAWPGILGIHQGAASKRKEIEKLCQEGKVPQRELQEVGTRSDVISYAILAEINNFHQTRARDMKRAHQHFLQEQISFYQKVINSSPVTGLFSTTFHCSFPDH